MLQAPGDPNRWFVVEQNGIVRVFDNNAAVATANVFIDVSARVASPADGRGGETGLLGMAFHPQFATNRRAFLSYTAVVVGNLVSRISEFRSVDAGLTLDPTPAAERIVLTVDQPQDNHNGGGIAFGPGGLLFIGLGDGGGANDEGTGHAAIGNGQDLTRLLGKMLRIDVAPALGYTIPAANPFASNPQCGPNLNAQSCPEVFAYGFRNPWRWSFDRSTGELWVGDVGQSTREEADKVALGANHGWKCREGSGDFRPTTCGPAQMLINPVVEYGRAAGFSITGGYIYRGTAIPALQGRYVFGDFGGRVWHIAGDTMPTLDVTNATASAPTFASGLSISSFAEGDDGELYVVHHGGTLHRLRAL